MSYASIIKNKHKGQPVSNLEDCARLASEHYYYDYPVQLRIYVFEDQSVLRVNKSTREVIER